MQMTLLFARSEEELERVVWYMYDKKAESECWESKVMVFQRNIIVVVDFNTLDKITSPALGR